MIHRGQAIIAFMLIMAKKNIDDQMVITRIHDVHHFPNI